MCNTKDGINELDGALKVLKMGDEMSNEDFLLAAATKLTTSAFSPQGMAHDRLTLTTGSRPAHDQLTTSSHRC